MTQYFSKFPKIDYTLDGVSYERVTDIIHRVDFLNVVLRNSVVMYPYTVKDGESPEIIAAKIYDSAQYHWVILFANDIFNLWTEWPKSYEQFVAYIEKTYDTLDYANATVHHYEDSLGHIIDHDTYVDLIPDGSVSISIMEYETQLNEQKRNILIVDPKWISAIENELDRRLK